MYEMPFNDILLAMKSDLSLESHLSIPPQVMSRLVDNETVLLDLSSGIYFGLDGVGNRIWESVSEGLNLAETVAVITSEFEVDETQAQSDVIEFARNLVERGLLEAN